MPSDEIRLYATDKQRGYTEYGTKSRIEHTEATFYLFFCVYTLYVKNMSSKLLALQVIKYV